MFTNITDANLLKKYQLRIFESELKNTSQKNIFTLLIANLLCTSHTNLQYEPQRHTGAT